jgi:hypothetical protein
MPRKSTAIPAAKPAAIPAKPVTKVARKLTPEHSAGSLTRDDILAVVGQAIATHPALQRADVQVVADANGPIVGNSQKSLQAGPATSGVPATPINHALDELHLQLQLLNADLGSMQEVLRPHLQNAVFDDTPAESGSVQRAETYRTYGSDMSPTLVALNCSLNFVEGLRERISFLTRNVVN